MSKTSKNKLTATSVIAMLSAVAFVLMLLEIPMTAIPLAAHLKMDLSDVPALFAAVLYGPGAGVVVELIKNVIEMLIKGMGTQMGFGNLMNFIVGCAFVVPFSLVYRSKKISLSENKKLIAACLCGFLSIVIIGYAANYVIAPLFFKHFLGIALDSESLYTAVIAATVVNVIKGALLSVAAFPIVKVLIKRVKSLI